MQTILELSISYGLSVCFCSDIHVKILKPKVMVLRDGNFGRCLCHECRALMNEISGFIKSDPLTLTSCEGATGSPGLRKGHSPDNADI